MHIKMIFKSSWMNNIHLDTGLTYIQCVDKILGYYKLFRVFLQTFLLDYTWFTWASGDWMSVHGKEAETFKKKGWVCQILLVRQWLSSAQISLLMLQLVCHIPDPFLLFFQTVHLYGGFSLLLVTCLLLVLAICLYCYYC